LKTQIRTGIGKSAGFDAALILTQTEPSGKCAVEAVTEALDAHSIGIDRGFLLSRSAATIDRHSHIGYNRQSVNRPSPLQREDERTMSAPASVLDVAQYIVDRQGPTDAMKLQKLVYYCQAWSMVWIGRPLFIERIEAWRDGPVVRELFAAHKGRFLVSSVQGGKSSTLTDEQKDIIDSVLGYYAGRTAQWLSERTHSERPWVDARRGLLPFHSSAREISVAALRDFYGAPHRAIERD
jgi:uncharacterized phage-associated protein